jgi:hypothetical protein
MTIRLKAVLTSLLMVLGLAVAITPAQAAAKTANCGLFAFCVQPDQFSNYTAAFSGSVPRNTCFNGFGPAGTGFATENTGVQWWLFRTGTCGGSHYVIHANVNQTLPVGWYGAIVAVMRTSTVGKS